MTVLLVTGVGGGVGQSIIKSLQNSRYTLVGADGDTLAAGLYVVPRAYRIPYAAATDYVDKLLDICAKEHCELLFPGLDAELPVLAHHRERLRQAGVIPIVSDPKVIDICDDKLATCRFLTDHGFDAPLTLPLSSAATQQIPFPMVLKPQKGGARSQGVFVVRNQEEFERRFGTMNATNYVAQEYIEGHEFTCGSLTFDGVCRGVIVMRRVLRDGDTYKAFVTRDEHIEAHVRKVAEALQPFGPCNFQLRVRNGIPYIFEINGRCSGTTHCRALAGYNEPLMTAEYLLAGVVPNYQIREISILRYWKELVVDNSAITRMRESGMLMAGQGGRL